MAETRGSTRAFSARSVTDHPDEVWRLWTEPSTWADWDRGLRSAELDGPFRPGATGTLVGLDGRRSTFVVDAVEPGRLVRWHVPLPGARMDLERTLGPDREVQHAVTFTGPLARAWALLLGRRFRPLLGPTVDALTRRAAT